jgi:SPP1 gp7 family putative phage head morphogenesis protein
MISAQVKIGDLLAQYLAASNLLGRLHTARAGARKTRKPIFLATGSRMIRSFADDQSDTRVTASFSLDVPPDGAIQYLRNLTPVTKHVFDGLTRQYRNDAFTVAGVNDQRVIAKIRDALGDVLQQGGTRDDFGAAVRKLSSEAGVEDLTSFELDTVFNTNALKAYGSGRLEQMQEPHMLQALPYWQYLTVGDIHVRPGHRELDGFVARAIDPVWRKVYPPWDFNCRCGAVSIPEDEALDIDPQASEGGLGRLGTRPLTLLELEQTSFRTVMA